MLQPIYSEEIPLLGELSVTWQEKFLGNECSLSICETAEGLEMSFQDTEGFWWRPQQHSARTAEQYWSHKKLWEILQGEIDHPC